MKTNSSNDLQELQTSLTYLFKALSVPLTLVRNGEVIFSAAATAFDPEPSLLLLQPLADFASDRTQMLSAIQIYCGIVPVPGTDAHILAGPVPEVAPTANHCMELLARMGLPGERTPELKYRLEKSPFFSNQRFLGVLRLLDYLFNHRDAVPLVLGDPPSPELVVQKRQLQQGSYHASAAVEERLLSLIAAGDAETLKEQMPMVYSSGSGTSDFGVDTLNQMRTLFITSVTLCSRAAVRGGMDYEFALSVSDDYIRRLYQTTDPNQILPQLGIMMLEYAEHVADVQVPENTSQITKAAVREVAARLQEPLRVRDIAGSLHVSESRLSHVFKEDMGTDLKTWILQQKVREARRMLSERGFSIQETADALSFSSQGHFGTVFKRFTGLTPLDYLRKGNNPSKAPVSPA